MIRMIAIVSSTSSPPPKQAPGTQVPCASMPRSGCNMNAGNFTKLNTSAVLAVLMMAFLWTPRVAEAQAGAFGKFLGGAAVALVAHESGHLLLDSVFGAGV